MDFKKSLDAVKSPQVKMSQYLNSESIQQTIANTLGAKNIQQCISDVVTMCNKNPGLRMCEPATVLMGALHGTVLHLNWQSGEYWLVPYEDRRMGTSKAQFQIGKAGMTQLARRSGQIAKIHTASIKEGEVVKIDPIQGEYEFNPLDIDLREKAPTVGYYAYFILTNGGKNESYWTKNKVVAHATEYSQAYRSKSASSPWVKHFDTMAENVVLFHLLKRSAPKSRDFAIAQTTNQSVLHDPYGKEVEYIDNPKSKGIKIITNDMPKPSVNDTIMKAVKEHGTKKAYEELLAHREASQAITKTHYEELPYTPTPQEQAGIYGDSNEGEDGDDVHEV